MTRILIVEDEPRISEFVSKGLVAAGYETDVVDDGAVALRRMFETTFHLVLLDVGLPSIDGFEVLHQLRGQGFTLPIIMLTARSSIRDTVDGLDAGANDYIAKPFRFDELLARVRTRLRDPGPAESTALVRGAVTLDPLSRRATSAGRDVELSAREFSLAEYFLRHPGQVLSREQLLSRVWGLDFDPGSNVVDVYVRYLRNKFGTAVITTVRGAGYRWE
ncbi:DNA-binding response OmpR family regulator [Microbacterium halimionae]|uniref:DNA-binding response OmpR family regulator n=1 Tax=Microbacterium halimionae TaxID=1526413 RepID=A0A7W3PL65_9MICO|nr:response regulator transcription factor [Microbacterium halimionae]MBA8815833.1 DNA-binding response OmpR family regulator [Microbacterium halimionae]NII95879.1 DNA-binding response OmpR family regulator [Microbacterium halimionae]